MLGIVRSMQSSDGSGEGDLSETTPLLRLNNSAHPAQSFVHQ
jgi:hypothetical protein